MTHTKNHPLASFKRILALVLCALMLFGMLGDAAPKAYASGTDESDVETTGTVTETNDEATDGDNPEPEPGQTGDGEEAATPTDEPADEGGIVVVEGDDETESDTESKPDDATTEPEDDEDAGSIIVVEDEDVDGEPRRSEPTRGGPVYSDYHSLPVEGRQPLNGRFKLYRSSFENQGTNGISGILVSHTGYSNGAAKTLSYGPSGGGQNCVIKMYNGQIAPMGGVRTLPAGVVGHYFELDGARAYCFDTTRPATRGTYQEFNNLEDAGIYHGVPGDDFYMSNKELIDVAAAAYALTLNNFQLMKEHPELWLQGIDTNGKLVYDAAAIRSLLQNALPVNQAYSPVVPDGANYGDPITIKQFYEEAIDNDLYLQMLVQIAIWDACNNHAWSDGKFVKSGGVHDYSFSGTSVTVYAGETYNTKEGAITATQTTTISLPAGVGIGAYVDFQKMIRLALDVYMEAEATNNFEWSQQYAFRPGETKTFTGAEAQHIAEVLDAEIGKGHNYVGSANSKITYNKTTNSQGEVTKVTLTAASNAPAHDWYAWQTTTSSSLKIIAADDYLGVDTNSFPWTDAGSIYQYQQQKGGQFVIKVSNVRSLGVRVMVEQNNGTAYVQKSSTNPSISGSNSAYSLAGAEYKVYASINDLTNNRNPLATLTTTANGKSNTVELEAGTYYIKETKAPNGFALDTSVHSFTVAAGETTVIPLQDKPKNDPVPILLVKYEKDANGQTVSSRPLAGAEFTVKFYAGLYDTAAAAEASGSPVRSWVFKTNAEGRADLSDVTCFVSGDELWRNANGNITFPIGTLVIQETKAPTGYRLNSTKYVVKITDSGASEEQINTYNEPTLTNVQDTTLRIVKTAAPDGTLSGWKFKITSEADSTKTYTRTTDANGNISVEGLDPGWYTVEEIEIPNYVRVEPASQRVEVKIGETARVSFTNRGLGNLEIIKASEDGNLAGHQFKITGPEYPNGVIKTTDANGKITLNKILVGSYTVEEIDVPGRFIAPANNPRTVTVEWKATASTNFENKLRKITVTVTKRDGETGVTAQGDAALNGAVYGLYKANGTKVAEGTITNGKYVFQNVGVGSYYLQEITAPTGYLLSNEQIPFEITLAMLDDTAYTDAAQNADDTVQRGGLRITKTDAETTTDQGDASLAGIQYAIVNRSAKAVAVNGTSYAPGKIVMILTTDANGSAATANKALPYGTYDVIELRHGHNATVGAAYADTLQGDSIYANANGYLWAESKVTVTIRRDGETKEAAFTNEVARGQFLLHKVDHDTWQSKPLGDGQLGGAEITITNISDHSIYYNNKTYASGEIVMVITTDSNGVAETPERALPYGTYVAKETRAPEGYLLNETWECRFVITEDGQTVETEGENHLDDLIKRGDFHFDKRESGTERPLANIVFKVTSLTTGEWHLIVTDENGLFASNRAPHDTNTNANDAALNPDGTIDESKLDPNAGVWFYGAADPAEGSPVRNERGAMPYDRYQIEELRTSANENLVPVNFTHRIGSENQSDLDLGSWKDDNEPQPIFITKVDITTQKEVAGAHIQILDNKGRVWDEWDSTGTPRRITGLSRNHSYILRETVAPNGYAVTTDTTFAILGNGLLDVSATTTTIVEDVDGVTLLIEDDLTTVYITKVDIFGEGELPGATLQVLDDTGRVVEEWVSTEESHVIRGLKTGVTYTLRETIAPDGYVLATDTSFCLKSDGTVDPESTTTKINDEGILLVENEPTPEIKTNICDEAGSQETLASTEIVLTDYVTYSNLVPGRNYTVKGVLYDKETEAPILDDFGNEITAEQDFVPETGSGTVELHFAFSGVCLAGKTIVACEELYREGILVAVHADLTDEDQTETFPKIETTATVNGEHSAPAAETVEIIDQVPYYNLVVGRTYKVSGILMDKTADEPLKNAAGEPYTAELTFVAEEANGTVELRFTVNTLDLAGQSVVVFEALYHNDREVAVHADITDEAQTIHIPKIGTVATDLNGSKEIEAYGVVEIADVVTYANLIPGTEYIIRGQAVNKADGAPVNGTNGQPATCELLFVPETADGSVTLYFTVNGNELAGKDVVIFETLFIGENELADHADLDDEAQTVHFPEITTTLVTEAEQHVAKPDTKTTVVDTVEYSNLTPGKTYRMEGKLMIQSTGKVLKDADKDPITASVEFVADESGSGTVDLTFTFDSSLLLGETVVAFETCYDGEKEIAFHHDINDESQSVHFPTIGTTASAEDGGKTVRLDKGQTTVVILDRVSYENLVPGETYTLSGVLHDKADGSVIRLPDGNAYVATTEFTPTEERGYCDVRFEVPATLLPGKTLVVFETLMLGSETVATHEDINDTAQAVMVTYRTELFKYDAGTTEGIEGVTFEVRDLTDKDAPMQTVTTDKDGFFHFDGAPGHEFALREIKAPAGYNFDSTREYFVTVQEDGTLKGDTEIPNVRGGTIVISKVDLVTGDPVEGCEITIYDKDHKEVCKRTTDKNGKIFFYTTEPGVYYYKETATVTGYYLNEEEYSFTVTDDLMVSGDVRFKNVPFGTVALLKLTKDGKPLAGAEISVYAKDGDKFLGKGVSNKDGRVYFVSPGPGEYYFVETAAPQGYKLNKEKQYFTVNADYTITGTTKLVNERGDSDSSETGDNSHLALWMTVACVSGLGLGAMVYWLVKKPRRKDEATDA